MTDDMTDEITEKFPATSKCDINFHKKGTPCLYRKLTHK